MAADSCPPSQRSRYFYYLYSTFLVCELIAPAFASATIERNLLIPFAVGLACLLLCFPVLGVMPETHKFGNHLGTSHRRPASPKDHNESHETDPLLSAPSNRPAASSGRTNDSLRAVLKDKNILLALFILFIGALRQGTISVLLQYAAVRFGWPTSRTAMLVSAIAASNIVLFLIVLPHTVAFLTSRWHILPQLIDYNVVSASLVILTVGSMLMGLAPSMTWLICGKSLLSKYISRKYTHTHCLCYSCSVLCLRLWNKSRRALPYYRLDGRGHARQHLRGRADHGGHRQTMWRSHATEDLCSFHTDGGRHPGATLFRCSCKSSQTPNRLEKSTDIATKIGFCMAAIAWRFVDLRMKSKDK